MLIRQKDFYSRISPYKRERIMGLIKLGRGLSYIARKVGEVSPSRVWQLKKEIEISKIPVDYTIAKSIILRRK
jgi:hypothetical protein